MGCFSVSNLSKDVKELLIRCLSSPCCRYDFLYKMVKVTSLYQHPEGAVMFGNGSVVQTNVALQIPDAPGLIHFRVPR